MPRVSAAAASATFSTTVSTASMIKSMSDKNGASGAAGFGKYMPDRLMYGTGRVYVGNARGGGGGLVLSNRGMQGKQLTVQIGRSDRIAVDQVQRADPGAGKGFYGIAADAADSEHRNA